MNNLPDSIIRYHLFPYLDVSEYYNVIRVSRYFNNCLIELLYSQKNRDYLFTMLKDYRTRKISWFGDKLQKIPVSHLNSMKAVDIYLLLQDIYHNTNYVDTLGITIPKRQTIESILRSKSNNLLEHKTRKHETFFKNMKQDIHLSINNSITKLSHRNNNSKKIKTVLNNK